MPPRLATERLILRPWRIEDATDALAIYGDERVAKWLSPAVERVLDVAEMRELLERWIADDASLTPPCGRWAIELAAPPESAARRTEPEGKGTEPEGKGGKGTELPVGQRVIGGAALLPLPPAGEDVELGWQLRPDAWGHGYATEAGLAVARWAFSQGIEEVMAVVRPANARGSATVQRLGMEWVGETEKYYDLRLQVFRLRPADLDPSGLRPTPFPRAGGSDGQKRSLK